MQFPGVISADADADADIGMPLKDSVASVK